MRRMSSSRASDDPWKSGGQGRGDYLRRSTVERVGFVLEAALSALQVAESNMTLLPNLPPLPRRITRYCRWLSISVGI